MAPVVLPLSRARAERSASALPEIPQGLEKCRVRELMLTRAACLGVCRPRVTGRRSSALSDPMDGVVQRVGPGEAMVSSVGVAIERGVGGIVRDGGSVAVGHDRIDRDAGEDHPRHTGRADEEHQQDGEEHAVRQVTSGCCRRPPGRSQTLRERRDGSSLPFCLPMSMLLLYPMAAAQRRSAGAHLGHVAAAADGNCWRSARKRSALSEPSHSDAWEMEIGHKMGKLISFFTPVH
jgi:hypothetical protein